MDKRAAEEGEAMRRQKELILMQAQAQNQLLQSAKEEAEATRIAQQAEAAAAGKVNVLDIKVDENINFDDI